MNEKKLLYLLQKKRSFFAEILELTESENSANLNDWNTLLKKKEVLLTCISKIDFELETFASNMVHLSQEVTDSLESIHSMVQEILLLGSENIRTKKKNLDPNL